ncbi:MAG TPA: UDP-N-acetylmuramate dehydrogenase, partial [Elusimicrobiota bacterium]|nr:UDP-N-acetylmuramate dehydrogenase [Elusimicrobiota bacterium]
SDHRSDLENHASILDELQAACAMVREQEPLSRHTSLAIGGPADFYAEPHHRDELAGLRRLSLAKHLPVFFIGAGSNLLVADKGIRGLVIRLMGDFRQAAFDGEHVTVGAAVWMPALVKQAAEHGLSGIESLIGVPGTVGGGLVMNAGTREGVLGDVVQGVELMRPDGSTEVRPAGELGFDYRHSGLEGAWILGATLRLKAAERSSIMERIDGYLQSRSRTQPLATSNCGSVFKNPPGAAAAQLIEQAGLKGHGEGGARISERHANFIINENHASAAAVRNLLDHVQKTVEAKFGVRLEPEVKLVGEW